MKLRSFLILLQLSFLVLFAFSCLTPQKAFEKGNYPTAFKLAVQKIKANKDIEENTAIVVASANEMVNQELNRNRNLIQSDNTKDWVIVQNRYYDLLEQIGNANKILNGGVTGSYNELCSAKQDIDFQITEYYYNNGQQFIDQAYSENSKKEARNAYYQFEKSKDSGGHLYFDKLDQLIDESRAMGVVYYISDGDLSIGSSLFLQPLPPNVDFEADCMVTISQSGINLIESQSQNEVAYEKSIQVDTEEVEDTAGVVTYIPIYEEIEAVVTTITTTVTVSQTVWINVNDNSGQCSLASDSFTTEISDSYDDVSISGDERALDGGIERSSGKPAFFISHLEDELEDAVEHKLWKW